MSRGRTYTLRNAASIVFALTAVIPLLLFTYTLYALNQLKLTEAQMGLGVALACALVGLFIFSNLMARLSEVLRYLEEQQDGAGRAGTGAVASAVPAAGGDVAGRPAAAPTRRKPAAPGFSRGPPGAPPGARRRPGGGRARGPGGAARRPHRLGMGDLALPPAPLTRQQLAGPGVGLRQPRAPRDGVPVRGLRLPELPLPFERG